MAGAFAQLLLDATEAWNDPDGFWVAYNTAIATMFETAYDLVADQGDINQTQLGVLTSPVTVSPSSASVGAFATSPLIIGASAGTEVLLVQPTGLGFQDFTLATDALPGATNVVLQPKSFAVTLTFPVGSYLVLDWEPGWSTLLDPDDCPDQFLPFLAQFNGTSIPVGLDAATARAKIVGESALQRGTLASVLAAVQRNLATGANVTIQERIDSTGSANAYWFVVTVKPNDLGVPAQTIFNCVTTVTTGPIEALINSVNAVKPGGVMWSLVIADAFAWVNAVHTWSADTLTWAQASNLQP